MKRFSVLMFIYIFTALQGCQKHDSFVETSFEFEWYDASKPISLSNYWGTESGYIVTNYNSSKSVLEIPSEFENEMVRYIDTSAFETNLLVTKLILPPSLLYIKNYLSEKMPNLTTVEVKDGFNQGIYYSRDGLLYIANSTSNYHTFEYIPIARTKDITIESDVFHLNIDCFQNNLNVKSIIINKNSNLISFSYTTSTPKIWDSLESIYVDSQQYDYFISFFAFNQEIIKLIKIHH